MASVALDLLSAHEEMPLSLDRWPRPSGSSAGVGSPVQLSPPRGDPPEAIAVQARHNFITSSGLC